MMARELAELSWVSLATDENPDEPEIFFLAQDVVIALRKVSEIHAEQAAIHKAEGDIVKMALHGAFSRWIHDEADTYSVAIMQAMLDHEANKAEDDG